MSNAVVDPVLAAAVLAEAGRHKLRSPGRRAAGHLWVCLMTTTSLEAAERAIATFGDERTRTDALALLKRITSGAEHQAALPEADRTAEASRARV
jgi:hypothetical protein